MTIMSKPLSKEGEQCWDRIQSSKNIQEKKCVSKTGYIYDNHDYHKYRYSDICLRCGHTVVHKKQN